MVDRVRLSLLVGPVIPVPVGTDVLDALRSVEVTTTSGKSSGFQLTFDLSTDSPLHTLFLLGSGVSIPIVRVIIVVTVDGVPHVLMDGVITHQQVAASKGAGQTTLTLIGEDLSRVMAFQDFTGILYPAMPRMARVALILAKYAFLGVVPLAIPSVFVDIPLPIDRIPQQRGNDLDYIKGLAEEVGYVFYVDPGPAPGTSFAYWGPEIRVGVPQPALNVDMDAHANVESVEFGYDTTRASLPVVLWMEGNTRAIIPIPVPDISPLSPPLGAVPPIPNRIQWLSGTAKGSVMRATAVALAKAARSNEAVTAKGSLDVLRYGRVLAARQLVGVRGAGTAFDGLYYVTRVKHTLARGEYKQEFTLTRNGLISTVAKVPA